MTTKDRLSPQCSHVHGQVQPSINLETLAVTGYGSDKSLHWRTAGVKVEEFRHICGLYSPEFLQRGPPTVRSSYVHREGLHTGRPHDAVTVSEQREITCHMESTCKHQELH